MSTVVHRVLNLTLVGCVAAAALVTPAGAATETVLYSFKGGSDGENPEAGLVNLGGTLYGTTSAGGASGCGTVFSITPAGVEKVLHSFNCGSEGSNPAGGLINVGGTLYGTTSSLGAYSGGTVFSVTRAGVLKVLYAFGKNSAYDAADPQAGLVNLGGTLYGTTYLGGANLNGTVFSVTLAGVEKVVYSFGSGGKFGGDGVSPESNLVNVNGTLYGTTGSGGNLSCNAGCGTVFSVTQAGVEKVLHSFTGGSDGSGPVGGLVYVGGTLYGTTALGGALTDCQGGCGMVFSITPAGVKKVMHSFGGFPGGRFPYGNLLSVADQLYGTAEDGGYPPSKRDVGTVFSMTRAGAMKVLHTFSGGSDGAYPYAGVTDVGGTFYGTTYQGGAYGYGTVFKVTP